MGDFAMTHGLVAFQVGFARILSVRWMSAR